MCDVYTDYNDVNSCVFYNLLDCQKKYVTDCPIAEIKFSDPCVKYFCPKDEEMFSNNSSSSNLPQSVQTGGFHQPFDIQLNFTLDSTREQSNNDIVPIILGVIGLLFFLGVIGLLIWKFGGRIWMKIKFGRINVSANFQQEPFEGDLSVLDGEDVSIRSGDVCLEMSDLSSASDSDFEPQVQPPQAQAQDVLINIDPTEDDVDPAGLLDDSFENYFNELPKKYRPKKKNVDEDCVRHHVAQANVENDFNSDKVEDGDIEDREGEVEIEEGDVEVVQILDLDSGAVYKVVQSD